MSLFVFGFVRLLPGDPARLVAGADVTEQEVASARESLGLDRPIWEQHLRYARATVRGDFGVSSRTREPVVEVIAVQFWPTLWLTLAAKGWATLVGEAIGVWAGVKRGRWQDQVAMLAAIGGVSFPGFWLGLPLIDLFSVHLGWLPTGGFDGWRSLIMPSFTLGVGVAAILTRFTRSAFVDVSGEDFVRTARSKGQHPASMTHAVVSREDRIKHGISDGLLRLSIGLENVDDVLDDLDQALGAL